MKQTILFALFLVGGFMGFAQNPLVKQWDKRFGGLGEEDLMAFQKTNDGGYILGGYTYSDSSFDISQHSRDDIIGYWGDFWVLKVDSIGNKQWDRTFGGNNIEYFFALQQTSDEGYILGGVTFSNAGGDVTQPTNGQYDFWIVKTDKFGNKQWDRRFGGTGSEGLRSLYQCKDGGYVLGGYTDSDSSGDVSQHTKGGSDYWMVKTDSLGNKLWDKRFGGSGGETLYSLEQVNDGGYILGGWSGSDTSGDVSQSSRGNQDYWIVKTDSLGNKAWDKRFGGSGHDYLRYVHQTSDEGFISGGITDSDSSGDVSQITRGDRDHWIVKTDSLGNKQWDSRFGGSFGEDEFGYAWETLDGGYILSGTSYSHISGDKTENNLGYEQPWIVKIDSLGNKQWDKTIFTNGHDETGFAIPTGDRCYIIANSTGCDTGGYKSQMNRGSSDYWIVKFCDTSFYCNLSSPTVLSNQSIFCSGDSTQICATASSVSYLWNTGQTTSCIYANHAGNYYVTVADANNCSAVSNHLAVNVYPIPPVSISVNGDTLHAFNAVTYQWYLNDTIINGATDSVYVANQTGNYTVAITDTNGCRVTSNAVSVVVSGIPKSAIANPQFAIYPNPTTYQLFIESTEEIKQVNIYNTLGEVVMAVSLNTKYSILNTAFLPTGVYIAEIKTKAAIVNKRWVKQ